MKTDKLHEALTDRFDDEDVEITQSMCDSYLNEIDETSIQSDIEATVSDSKITGDRANGVMDSHNSDADTVVKIENGDSTLYEFFDESDDVSSAVDARKTELIKSRVNSEIISRASGMVPIPPDPDTAYADIEQLIIDAFNNDGSSTPELDAMELINRYPAVVKALERENYQKVSTFLNKKIKPNESIIDDALETNINNVLKV